MKKLFALLAFIIALMTQAVVQAAETLSYVPENPEYALVMIHGYGQSGDKMKRLEKRLQEVLPNVALYFPTAPNQSPIGGYQWFDIPFSAAETVDMGQYDKMMKEALENVEYLHKVIDDIHEAEKIPYENISVAGFSQGGLMALLTGLTNSHGLHKVVSFSGVPLLLTKDFTAKQVKASPQILIIQGDNDKIIPPLSVQMTNDTLVSLGNHPTWHIIHGMTHKIGAEALQRFGEFMVFEFE